jgi:hypothetical protein
MFRVTNVTRNTKTDTPSVSLQITPKFSQTRSQGLSWGPRPRRLTKILQPSSQFVTGGYRNHKTPEDVQETDWCSHMP